MKKGLNSSGVPLRALYKILALLTFFSSQFALEAGGLSVEVISGERIVARGEALAFNFQKERESFDYLLFETNNSRDFYLKVNAPQDRRYSLDLLSLKCARGRASDTVLSDNGELLLVRKTYPPYTALDFKGNMVRDLLCCSDERFWEQKRTIFKPSGEAWVNIDFKKETRGEYVIVEYLGNMDGEPIIRTERGRDKKTEEKGEKISLRDTRSILYFWDNDKWNRLGELQPVPRGTERRLAFRLNSESHKFRITLPAGFLKINAVFLAQAEVMKTERLGLDDLPRSLKVVDRAYHTLEPRGSLNFSFRAPENEVCVLSLKGYFEVIEKESDIPKGIDDLVNRFLSRIKFWSQ